MTVQKKVFFLVIKCVFLTLFCGKLFSYFLVRTLKPSNQVTSNEKSPTTQSGTTQAKEEEEKKSGWGRGSILQYKVALKCTKCTLGQPCTARKTLHFIQNELVSKECQLILYQQRVTACPLVSWYILTVDDLGTVSGQVLLDHWLKYTRQGLGGFVATLILLWV